MKKSSERGQNVLVLSLALAIVATLLILAMAFNQRNMQAGASSIGNSIGWAIEDATALDYNAENDPAVLQTINQSMSALVANSHAVATHGADALRSVDCFNRNGTWRAYRVGNQEFHMLCKDDDGSLRDIVLKRQSNTSNKFDMKTAFTPKDGGANNVLYWLQQKGAQLVTSLPKDMLIFIDGMLP